MGQKYTQCSFDGKRDRFFLKQRGGYSFPWRKKSGFNGVPCLQDLFVKDGVPSLYAGWTFG
jgi:hypothetical protein